MSGTYLFWLTPLFPLTAFALLAIGLNRYGRLASGLAIIAMTGSTIVSLLGLLDAAQGKHAFVSVPWLTVGGRQLSLALWLEPLSALMATLVSIIGLIVFVYAASYMAEDPRRGRFFAEFSLFTGSMLTLVLAADLITLFIAWELVGLCSYLLIGFWFERSGVPAAASKAFFTTRLADLAFLAGVLLLIGAVGSGRIDTVLSAATHGSIASGLLFTSALLLFIGAAGKSAQFPFQGWLPDAMLGPTPVSALLHSATMVAAGVFLVARLYPLFLVAGSVLQLVAWIGVITALLGGAAALVESDLKRTLAYSTMSQIGLMFVGLGSGSLLAGVLLLVAQAFYKAALFLAAGAVDHAVEGTAFERMGGLAKHMPLTAIAFALSAAALAGLPVTLALPPKDPVLAAAWQTNGALFVASLFASFLTALYSTRAFGLVFLGISSRPAQQAHEAQRGLLLPLLVMAGLVPVGLLADAALLGHPLNRLLGTSIPDVPTATILTLSAAGIGVATGLWAQRRWPASVRWPLLQSVTPLFVGEFGMKALYSTLTQAAFWIVGVLGTCDRLVFDTLITTIIRGVLLVVRTCSTLDRRIFDAFAGTIAKATVTLVRASARFDARQVDGAVRDLGQSILALGQRVRVLQTGRIENYLLMVFVWGLGVMVLAVLAAVMR
ncbi:MAG: NADH-quinone oxidoreductase subunit L [Chloroflexota bacterium]|nr:NADH-quinone oxidoreductase subunit L [Chloroflexota bacterium]